jgi:hypothetical protein
MKERRWIKLVLKLWLTWTFTITVLACILISRFDRECDEKACECGRGIVTWIIIYASIMMGYVCCTFRHYIMLFTLFASRRKSKGFNRQLTLVFNPLMLMVTAIGIYTCLKTQKRMNLT